MFRCLLALLTMVLVPAVSQAQSLYYSSPYTVVLENMLGSETSIEIQMEVDKEGWRLAEFSIKNFVTEKGPRTWSTSDVVHTAFDLTREVLVVTTRDLSVVKLYLNSADMDIRVNGIAGVKSLPLVSTHKPTYQPTAQALPINEYVLTRGAIPENSFPAGSCRDLFLK